jgi:hypothetical protein
VRTIENYINSKNKRFHEKKLRILFVCLAGSSFLKIIFQTFLCLFAITKISQQKIFSNQRKIWLGFQESVFFLFERKTF